MVSQGKFRHSYLGSIWHSRDFEIAPFLIHRIKCHTLYTENTVFSSLYACWDWAGFRDGREGLFKQSQEEVRKGIPLLELKWAMIFGNAILDEMCASACLFMLCWRPCYCFCWWIISFDKMLRIHLYVCIWK